MAGERVAESIALERDLLRELRADADLVLDTSDLNVHELRAKILAAFADEAAGLVTVTSAGFKYRPPLDADMVVDVRFLPNPHWCRATPALAPTRRCATMCSPRTAPACSWPGWRRCWRRPCPATSRRASITSTVAISCTGGKHRSVVLATELAGWLTDKGYRAHVAHRDVEREWSPPSAAATAWP